MGLECGGHFERFRSFDNGVIACRSKKKCEELKIQTHWVGDGYWKRGYGC